MKKKLCMVLLLALASSRAIAEWVQIGQNAHSTLFVEPKTLEKSEGRWFAPSVFKMWDMASFANPQSVGGMTFLSKKSLSEYDCKETKWRVLSLSFHAGNMGRGDVLASYSAPQQWEPVPPSSVISRFWRYACKGGPS